MVFECGGCPRSFPTFTARSLHREQEHGQFYDGKTGQCALCREEFFVFFRFYDHFVKAHSEKLLSAVARAEGRLGKKVEAPARLLLPALPQRGSDFWWCWDYIEDKNFFILVDEAIDALEKEAEEALEQRTALQASIARATTAQSGGRNEPSLKRKRRKYRTATSLETQLRSPLRPVQVSALSSAAQAPVAGDPAHEAETVNEPMELALSASPPPTNPADAIQEERSNRPSLPTDDEPATTPITLIEEEDALNKSSEGEQQRIAMLMAIYDVEHKESIAEQTTSTMADDVDTAEETMIEMIAMMRARFEAENNRKMAAALTTTAMADDVGTVMETTMIAVNAALLPSKQATAASAIPKRGGGGTDEALTPKKSRSAYRTGEASAIPRDLLVPKQEDDDCVFLEVVPIPGQAETRRAGIQKPASVQPCIPAAFQVASHAPTSLANTSHVKTARSDVLPSTPTTAPLHTRISNNTATVASPIRAVQVPARPAALPSLHDQLLQRRPQQVRKEVDETSIVAGPTTITIPDDVATTAGPITSVTAVATPPPQRLIDGAIEDRGTDRRAEAVTAERPKKSGFRTGEASAIPWQALVPKLEYDDECVILNSFDKPTTSIAKTLNTDSTIDNTSQQSPPVNSPASTTPTLASLLSPFSPRTAATHSMVAPPTSITTLIKANMPSSIVPTPSKKPASMQSLHDQLLAKRDQHSAQLQQKHQQRMLARSSGVLPPRTLPPSPAAPSIRHDQPVPAPPSRPHHAQRPPLVASGVVLSQPTCSAASLLPLNQPVAPVQPAPVVRAHHQHAQLVHIHAQGRTAQQQPKQRRPKPRKTDPDIAFCNGNTGSDVCPRCQGEVRGHRSLKRLHFLKYHYHVFYPKAQLPGSEDWKNLERHLGECLGPLRLNRVCLHCPNMSEQYPSRIRLLEHLRTEHKEAFAAFLLEYRRLKSLCHSPMQDTPRDRDHRQIDEWINNICPQ